MFKIGDLVQWESQSGGSRKKKVGRIVKIIPAKRHPGDLLGKFSMSNNYGLPRNHKSYLVQVGNSIRLYWPRVVHLKKVTRMRKEKEGR